MKDPLDKLFVNCNKIKEGEFHRILNSKKDISLKSWKWDIPLDIKDKSSADINRFETYIGVGRCDSGKGEQFVCIAKRNELIYLDAWLIKVLNSSIESSQFNSSTHKDGGK